MKPRLALLAAATVFILRATAAEEELAPKSRMKEVLKARAAEEAKKQPATIAPAPAKSAKEKAEANPATLPAPAPTTTTAATAKQDSAPTSPTATSGSTAAKAATETPTVLPKVEVRKDRITEIDRQIFLQEQDIAREKKNLKQTEADKALNDPKVAKALAIFGGESSRHRAGIAAERVNLMEEEKDLLEAIRHAKTKEQKAELQKQLDELRAVRRELEKSLR